MTLPILTFLLFAAVQLGVSAYAIRCGGEPERAVAAMMLGAWLLTLLTAHRHVSAYEATQWGVLATDIGMLFGLALVAGYSKRQWTLWIAALQLIAVLLHLARLFDPTMLRSVYSIVQRFWAYPMLACLMIGTMRHRRRIARRGSDSSWSVSLRP